MDEVFRLSQEDAARCCQGSLPEQVIEGLALFNRGEYFEAHEVLELAWRAESSPVREMYRGILQVGVAYYHIQNGNFRGAVKMLRRAEGWLAPFPSLCRGIDLDGLRRSARRVAELLIRLGPDNIASFDTHLFQPVHYRGDQP